MPRKNDVRNDELISAFEISMHELAAMQGAQYSADSSAHQTQALLRSLHPQNGLYVTPRDITGTDQQDLVAMSVDSQLKEAQSHQITEVTERNVKIREEHLIRKYVGKKVSFESIDTSLSPFESLWLDSRMSQYKTSVLTAKIISGIVEDILLTKNIVVLQPVFWQRKLNPNRKYIVVSIMNPSTLRRAVRIN